MFYTTDQMDRSKNPIALHRTAIWPLPAESSKPNAPTHSFDAIIRGLLAQFEHIYKLIPGKIE